MVNSRQISRVSIELTDGETITINDQYMIDQIEGLLSAISRKDREEIVNMLNEVDRNERSI